MHEKDVGFGPSGYGLSGFERHLAQLQMSCSFSNFVRAKKSPPRGEAPPIGARANPGVYPPLDLYGTPEKTGPAEHYHHLWVTVA